jgi:hypothetical protein
MKRHITKVQTRLCFACNSDLAIHTQLQIRKVSGVAFDLEAVAAALAREKQRKSKTRRCALISSSDALVSPPSKALFGI